MTELKMLAKRKILLSFLIATAIFLFSAKIIQAAVSIVINSAPTEAQLEEEFTLEASSTGLVPETNYYFKCRIGKTSSSMNKGETFNEATSTWLSDSSAWVGFPMILANSQGNLSFTITCRPKQTAELGENLLTVRLRKVGASSNAGDSDSVTILLLTGSTPTPTSSLTPTATPTPTSTPTPTPAPATGAYKINEVKNGDGEVLSSVKVYVDGVYLHHYAPEELAFCDGCKCDTYVDCGFGEHTIKLEKSGYQDWSEIKTINSGDFFEVNPVMQTTDLSISPTSTPTPTKKIASPTPTPKKVKLISTMSGEILGEGGEATTAFYPLEATEGAELESEEATPSSKKPWLPKLFLVLGSVILFGAAFSIWYNYLRSDEKIDSNL